LLSTSQVIAIGAVIAGGVLLAILQRHGQPAKTVRGALRAKYEVGSRQ
jgi:hypothetical protein